MSWFYGNRMVDFVGYLYSTFIAKRMLNAADGIQLMTVQLLADVKKLNPSINDKKTFVCSTGVDTEQFRPVNSQSFLKDSLGINEDNTVIIYVGRLDTVKGVDYLLQAAKRILHNNSNVTFLIVGDGGLRQEYEQFAKPLYPSVIFTGWRDDVPRLMKIADIFILPSLSEGAPNVVMEASASGLPVIATEVGAIPWIVANGETGILVKPRDVIALVEATERLIDNPLLAKRMGEMGRKRIKKQYDWGTVCDNLETGYKSTIERFRLNDLGK